MLGRLSYGAWPHRRPVARPAHHAARPGRWPAAYLTRRPWKKPLLVVFCLTFAVSPCSAVLTCDVAESFETSDFSPGPFLTSIGGRHRRHMVVAGHSGSLRGCAAGVSRLQSLFSDVEAAAWSTRAQGEGTMMVGLGSFAAQIAADGKPAIAQILTEHREETLHLEFKTLSSETALATVARCWPRQFAALGEQVPCRGCHPPMCPCSAVASSSRLRTRCLHHEAAEG